MAAARLASQCRPACSSAQDVMVPSCSYPVQQARPRYTAAAAGGLNWTGASRVAPAGPCRSRPGPATRPVSCSVSSEEREADPTYMEEYGKLKEKLVSQQRNAGGGLAAYLLFTVDGAAALCALAGSAAANIYLLWLFRDVDSVTGNDRVALWEADKIENNVLRTVARVAAGYSHALRPRLLVPIGLAAAMAAFNRLTDNSLDTLHEGCLLLGFLSYKVPLILRIADDNLPKAYKSDEMSRPIIEKFDDELDQWGRPKKQLVPLPTEALPENVSGGLEEAAQKLPLSELGKISSIQDALNVVQKAAAGPAQPGQEAEGAGAGPGKPGAGAGTKQ